MVASYLKLVGKEYGWKFDKLYNTWHVVSLVFWDKFTLWFIIKGTTQLQEIFELKSLGFTSS